MLAVFNKELSHLSVCRTPKLMAEDDGPLAYSFSLASENAQVYHQANSSHNLEDAMDRAHALEFSGSAV